MKSVAFGMTAVAALLCWLLMPVRAQQGDATPRTPDGHPDLTGLWNGPAGGGGGGRGGAGNNEEQREKYGAVGFDPNVLVARQTEGHTGVAGLINFERDNTLVRRMGANKPLYKPKYWDTVRNFDQNSNTADPAQGCMPAGVPRLGPPAQIVELPKQLVMIYPGQGGAIATTTTYRMIPTDGRKHTDLEDLDGSWNGEGIGHWEGDTMVIDTIGFNTSTWIDTGGYFHSENMHVIEKLTRNGNALTWEATVDDPDVLLQPWVMDPHTVHLNTNPMALLQESPPCSERDYAHVSTKEHH